MKLTEHFNTNFPLDYNPVDKWAFIRAKREDYDEALGTLILVLLASGAGAEQTSSIARLQDNDLYERGTNCQGAYYRFSNNQMILFGGDEPQVYSRDITLLQKENSVVVTDQSPGKFTLNSVFTFSGDQKFVTYADFYYDPEPTEQQWRQMDMKAGDAKAEFQAYRDSLKGMPQMEVCPRKHAS